MKKEKLFTFAIGVLAVLSLFAITYNRYASARMDQAALSSHEDDLPDLSDTVNDAQDESVSTLAELLNYTDWFDADSEILIKKRNRRLAGHGRKYCNTE